LEGQTGTLIENFENYLEVNGGISILQYRLTFGAKAHTKLPALKPIRALATMSLR